MPTPSQQRVNTIDVAASASPLPAPRRILYIGCPPIDRSDLEKRFAAARMTITWVDAAPQAIAELQRREVPVVLDLARPGMLQIARDLRAHRPGTTMFAVTDPGRSDLTTEAILGGLVDVFVRPVSPQRVASAIDREAAHRAFQPEADAETATDELYAQSPAMREVAGQLAQAATSRTGVIVRGEDGTGRQVVARALHAAAGSKKFIVVDCAGFEPRQLQHELFGERTDGEPSGADLERISVSSRLYAAMGGTIYLQHLAEAPTRVQARLARLFRDREAVLIETGETITFDARPVSSVDQTADPTNDVRLHQELYGRMAATVITVPPLRQRREDIPAIANAVLRRMCADRRLPAKTFSRPALSLLSALPWRGNVVELTALFETVVGLGAGAGIGLDDVLRHVRLDGAAVFGEGGTLRKARARFEREYIIAILEQHRGRMTEAAQVLGIQRTNLYRKIRMLKVTRNRARELSFKASDVSRPIRGGKSA